MSANTSGGAGRDMAVRSAVAFLGSAAAVWLFADAFPTAGRSDTGLAFLLVGCSIGAGTCMAFGSPTVEARTAAGPRLQAVAAAAAMLISFRGYLVGPAALTVVGIFGMAVVYVPFGIAGIAGHLRGTIGPGPMLAASYGVALAVWLAVASSVLAYIHYPFTSAIAALAAAVALAGAVNIIWSRGRRRPE